VTRVVLNTNGIRIAADTKFMSELARLRDRVEVYSQFDASGPRPIYSTAARTSAR